MDVRWWNRWLFSKPDPDGWIFRLMIDTYETGFGFVTNYLLADTLSAVSIAENVKKGHLFVAFNSLADAAGFNYYAVGSSGGIAGIMGDSVRADQVKEIRAVSPFPGQARLFHNGKTIEVTNADVYEYSFKGPLEKGAYRIELQLKLRGKYIPWLYSNPIYVY
jgi:hypothetical protein